MKSEASYGFTCSGEGDWLSRLLWSFIIICWRAVSVTGDGDSFIECFFICILAGSLLSHELEISGGEAGEGLRF